MVPVFLTEIESMRILLTSVATVVVVCGANAAVAQCSYPEKSSVPNGLTATEAEMIEGQRAVKKFMADMDEYLACLESESESAKMTEEDAEAALQHEAIAAKKHNAAVDDMERLAAAFNEQVRAFKGRDE